MLVLRKSPVKKTRECADFVEHPRIVGRENLAHSALRLVCGIDIYSRTFVRQFLAAHINPCSSRYFLKPFSCSFWSFARIYPDIFSLYAFTFARIPSTPAPIICAARMPAFFAPLMATVATGTPGGICAVEKSASTPAAPIFVLISGTPITGSAVCAATTPAKCAAPPAPQMNTLYPAASLFFTYSTTASGVRCAESVCTSDPMPNSSSTFVASCITGRSESEPITIPTSGSFIRECIILGFLLTNSLMDRRHLHVPYRDRGASGSCLARLCTIPPPTQYKNPGDDLRDHCRMV